MMKKWFQKTPSHGFSLVELLTVVVILGVLVAIAGPIYGRYIRKSRTSEALANLGSIAMYEETYFSEGSTYVTVGPNPPGNVPGPGDPGGRKPFSTGVSNWNLLGRVMPDGTPLIFQYEARAGQFDSSAAAVTGLIGNLVSPIVGYKPGTNCTNTTTLKAIDSLNIPLLANSNWFYITAVGNQKKDPGSEVRCSLFIKVIDRPDIFKKDEIE